MKVARSLTIACLLALTACPVTVPTPTSRAEFKPNATTPKFLNNIAPRQVFPSFVPRFGDLNSDGHLDLLIGSKQSDMPFVVEWGDGKGHWRYQPGPKSYLRPHDMAIGEVDADGRPEVLIGGEGEQRGLQIWGLDDKGAWRLTGVPTTDGVFRGVALQDVNGDSWPDVIAAGMEGDKSPGGVRIWLNNTKGGWIESPGLALHGNFTGLAVADLNGDGHEDVVASELDNMATVRGRLSRYTGVGGIEVWYGDGKGHWNSQLLPVDAGGCESVSVADVNGDGRPDIIAGLYLHGVRVWLNKGGEWDRETVTDTGTWGAVRYADLNGNGHKQLIVASRDGQGLGVWDWNNSSLFGSGNSESVDGMLPNTGLYFGMDAGDIFDDGHTQLAVARGDGGVEVWSKRVPQAVVGQVQAQHLLEEKPVDLYHVSENKVFKTIRGVTEYRIGPGDEVVVTMWQGDKPTNYKLLVRADGTISMPFFPSAKIGGMTSSEVAVYLTKELRRYLRHPRVDVLVTKMKSKSVKVFGAGDQKNNPSGGTFYLTGKETLVDLMSRLGTIKDADLSRVRLVRNGKTRVLDVQRAIRQGDELQNAVLDDGDTVDIPTLAETQKSAYVLGEVTKPRRILYNGTIRILDAISSCEGFTPNAYYPDIRLVRTDMETPKVYAIAMDRLLKEGDVSQNMVLHDNDIIIVPADPITNWNNFINKLLPTINGVTSSISQVKLLRNLLKNSAGTSVLVNAGG